MTPLSFITKIKPGADCCELEKGIPAAFTIAQAALESSWGSSGLAVKANNLFGIKATRVWKGQTLTMMTSEFIDGKWIKVPAAWRSYDTWADCLLDHADFFKVNPRYAKALEYPHDGVMFATEVAAAGYATDPEYLEKLTRVMRVHSL